MKREKIIVLAVLAAILAFYRWTVTSNSVGPQPLFGGEQQDYYQLLTDGFLQGHLYLNLPPDPRLLAAKDPFDPAQRAGALLPHDVSFHGGHYYIYYGVTPVLILRLPWRLLTGHDLPQNYAVLIFVAVGYLAAAGTWLALRRRYFPSSGRIALGTGLAVLGLASMTHAVLRRSSIWEEPIAAGYACAMLMLLCLYRAQTAPRRRAWLAAAGLCLGLAVGARPNYAVAVVALLVVPVFAWWRGRRGGEGRSSPDGRWWREAAAPLGGFGVVVLGLAWYNYARFGSPVEFGTSFMFTNPYGSAGKNLALRFFRFNAFAYYLAPAQWSRYFPFAKMIHLPPLPADYSGSEFVYGLLPNFPLVGFALLAPLAWWRRPLEPTAELRVFVVTLTGLFAAMGALLAFFVSATGRYMVDFAPALMLLACIGLLAAERAATGRIRALVLALAGSAAAFSAFVGVMVNLQVHDLLRQSNPRTYLRLAHAFDLPVYALERLAGTRYGPIELALKFPRTPAGTTESLVTTGWEYESDYLLVNYVDGRHLKFGFDHSSHGVIWSQPIELDYGKVHQLRLQFGSLFPPLGHPFFDRLSPAAVADASRGVHLTIDGRAVLDARQYAYDGSPGSLRLGAETGRQRATDTFSGTILAMKRDQYEPPAEGRVGAAGYGWVEFQLTFPGQTLNRGLPLIATGETGRGDLLSIKFVRPGIARFFYDHWGIGLWQSEEVPVSTDVPHRLRIGLPALLLPPDAEAPEAELRLELDGRTIWSRQVPFYPVQPADVYLGRNGIGASTADQEFPGAIRRIDPSPPASAKAP